jgi:hypothetical protein
LASKFANDVGARPLAEHNPVAGFHVERLDLSLLVARTSRCGNYLALLRLFLRRVGNDDAVARPPQYGVRPRRRALTGGLQDDLTLGQRKVQVPVKGGESLPPHSAGSHLLLFQQVAAR